jgi:hypothetical protein
MNMRQFKELIEKHRFIRTPAGGVVFVMTFNMADETANVLNVGSGVESFLYFKFLLDSQFCELVDVDHDLYGKYYKVKGGISGLFSVVDSEGFRVDFDEFDGTLESQQNLANLLNEAYERGTKEAS